MTETCDGLHDCGHEVDPYGVWQTRTEGES